MDAICEEEQHMRQLQKEYILGITEHIDLTSFYVYLG